MALKPILINTRQTLVRQVSMTDPLFGMGFSGKLRKAVSAPVNTSLPTIDNMSPRVGDPISVSNGSWTQSPLGYTYQWKLNGSDIPGETNSSYIVQAGDFDLTLTCVVTAFNAVGATSAESAATNSVQDALPAAPVNTSAPNLFNIGGGGGTDMNYVIQGDTITTDNGVWQNDPTSFGYSWIDVGNATVYSNNSSLDTAGVPAGRSIIMQLTASNEGGTGSAPPTFAFLVNQF